MIYGCTYVTQDLDICCEFSTNNLKKLYDALKDLNPVHRMTPNKKAFVFDEQTGKDFNNLYLNTDHGQLDCLGVVSGIGDYPHVFKASREIEVEGQIFRILTIDALIAAKSSLNRPHDRFAIEQLRKVKEMDL